MTIRSQHLGLASFVCFATAVFVAILAALSSGCSSAPPEIRAGGLSGTLVLESPAGPITVDLGAGVIVGDTEGWRVAGYEASAYVVVDYQGIAHRVEVDAAGRCVVAHYQGIVVLDYPIPGSECLPTPGIEGAPEGR